MLLMIFGELKGILRLRQVAAELGVPIILMHNRDNEEYNDFWTEAKQDLDESIQIAKAAGVPDATIWLDPGIGFVKSNTQNILMMQHLDDLVEMGYPVLLATSRKRVIGKCFKPSSRMNEWKELVQLFVMVCN